MNFECLSNFILGMGEYFVLSFRLLRICTFVYVEHRFLDVYLQCVLHTHIPPLLYHHPALSACYAFFSLYHTYIWRKKFIVLYVSLYSKRRQYVHTRYLKTDQVVVWFLYATPRRLLGYFQEIFFFSFFLFQILFSYNLVVWRDIRVRVHFNFYI